jgi:hypothetical protein
MGNWEQIGLGEICDNEFRLLHIGCQGAVFQFFFLGCETRPGRVAIPTAVDVGPDISGSLSLLSVVLT